jgi:hypothetical protein
MTLTRRGSYTATLGALLALLLLSILAAVAAFVEQGKALAWQKQGGPDLAGAKTVAALQAEITGLRESIRRLQDEDVFNRQHELHKLNLRLSQLGLRRVSDDNWSRVYAEGTGDWTLTRSTIEAKLSRMSADADRLRSYDQSPQLHEALNDAYRKLRLALGEVMEQVAKDDTIYQADKQRLLDKIDELDAAIRQETSDHAIAYGEQAIRKSRLDTEIRELLALKLEWLEALEPVGKVIESDSERGFIIINLGARSRVQRGLRFEVFTFERGRFQGKGLIEVIRTKEDWATCRLLDYDSQSEVPIANGDFIGNPIFSVERAPTFALAGTFEHFNQDDLAYFIEQTGGEIKRIIRPLKSGEDERGVQRRIGPGIDFLVAGNGSDIQQEEARQYHMIAIDEPTIRKFLNPRYPAPVE